MASRGRGHSRPVFLRCWRSLPVILRCRHSRYVLLKCGRNHLTTLYRQEVMHLGWRSRLLMTFDTGMLEITYAVRPGEGSSLELGYARLQDLDNLSLEPELGLKS